MARRRHSLPNRLQEPATPLEQDHTLVATPMGVWITIATAFLAALAIHWLRGWFFWKPATPALFLSIALPAISGTAGYVYLRRQCLHKLRLQAIDRASKLTVHMQAFDEAASTGITMVQEVELVSRGYQINDSTPPISRLDGNSQTRKCCRLRRALRRALDCMFVPYYQAYQRLGPLALELDLDKYFDIYEICHIDKEDVEAIASTDLSTLENADSLLDLKLGLQKLHIIRKMVLCALLAFDADGGHADFMRWPVAVEVMDQLWVLIEKVVGHIDEFLREEEGFPVPPTPKLPMTPGKERMRSQMRKLGNLSHGIRGLQAKMRLLREESDKVLEEPEDSAESTTRLVDQYDSIGIDLKDLMDEWQQGRAALTTALARHTHSRSVSANRLSVPLSPALSLGGTTAVEGSPKDALKALNGALRSSSMSSTASGTSDEQVFEAVAIPRQRSTLTREERVAKMKEDRLRQAVDRANAQASTHMLKELETVIKLRPRGRTTGRMTSI